MSDLCSGGELWGRVRSGVYSERDAARIVAEILRTIAQCHARGIIVRDVKPEVCGFASAASSNARKAPLMCTHDTHDSHAQLLNAYVL